MKQQRENFRITYTATDHPKIFINGELFRVIDISCGGISYAVDNATNFPDPAVLIKGILEFQDKSKISIFGKILRINRENRIVIIELKQQLEMGLIMQQHRLWINRYK